MGKDISTMYCLGCFSIIFCHFNIIAYIYSENKNNSMHSWRNTALLADSATAEVGNGLNALPLLYRHGGGQFADI